jgi:ankyrin repeat protein
LKGFTAARFISFWFTRELVIAGPALQEIDGPAGGDGPSALHMAAALGHVEILQLLLDHGDPLLQSF